MNNIIGYNVKKGLNKSVIRALLGWSYGQDFHGPPEPEIYVGSSAERTAKSGGYIDLLFDTVYLDEDTKVIISTAEVVINKRLYVVRAEDTKELIKALVNTLSDV